MPSAVAAGPAEATEAQISAPLHLSPKSPDRALVTDMDQHLEALLNNSPLARRPAGAHGLAHQVIVDVDVRTHESSMCKDRQFMCSWQARGVREQTASASRN